MPTTPNGTRTRRIFKPFGRVTSKSNLPIGSGNLTTCRIPSAMSAILFGVKIMRSIMFKRFPLDLTASTSLALTSKISSCAASKASAIAKSALLRTSSGNHANFRDASFARRACFVTCSFMNNIKIPPLSERIDKLKLSCDEEFFRMTRRKREGVVRYVERETTLSGGKRTVTCLSVSTAAKSCRRLSIKNFRCL